MAKDYKAILTEVQGRLAKTGKEIPETMGAFMGLHKLASSDGALDAKTKELMAMAIGICTHCEGCIVFHMAAALKAGATKAEVLDAVTVAIEMGGGPSVIYGSQAVEAVEQLAAVG